MAEFLIYDGPNWWEGLHPLALGELLKDPVKKRKYEARYMPGDIIQVFPDGRCTERVADGVKMRILKVPGMSYKDAKHLEKTGPVETEIQVRDEVPKRYLTRNRIHSVDMDGITLSGRVGAIDSSEFDLRLTTKVV